MVVRLDDLKIKQTARIALPRVSVFYLSGESGGDDKGLLDAFLEKKNAGTLAVTAPFLNANEFPSLVAQIAQIHLPRKQMVRATLNV